jgi:hypothetical protein
VRRLFAFLTSISALCLVAVSCPAFPGQGICG